MNNTSSYYNTDNAPLLKSTGTKLHWLLILIPLLGAFIICTYIKIRKNHKKRKGVSTTINNTNSPIATTDSHIVQMPPSGLDPGATNVYNTTSSSEDSRLAIAQQHSMNQFLRAFHRNGLYKIKAVNPLAAPPVYSVTGSPPKYEDINMQAIENEQ